ncbi:MAG: tetratricopeptide repeat protein [Rhizomicrobium sp.]
MHRLAVRIAAFALCAGTLGGCGAFGGSDTDAGGAPARGADVSPMAPDVDAAVRQAQALRLGGDVAGATRIMSQLMLVYPDDPRVVGEYGKLLVQQKASGDAIAFLRRAIQLQPNDWSTYSALGVAFDQRNDPANARLAYERALALKPGEPAILNNYAMSRMLAGDTASARTLLMQAQASGSADPRIASNLALLDRTAPVMPTAMPAPTAPTGAIAGAPATRPVARTAMPPIPSASGAPRPLTQDGARVVMQEVPVDALAGPVAATAPKPAKPAARPTPRVAQTTPKPPKKTKPAASHIPALRMTADASRP